MNKEELEEKIKNNESVWFVDFRNKISKLTKKEYYENCGVLADQLGQVFSTKAQAQHYLDNANITRTEKLPFVTWEEVKEYSDQEFYIIEFYNKNYLSCCIEVNFSFKYIGVFEGSFLFKDSRYDLTEENFYKAYKVAKDLFLGGE